MTTRVGVPRHSPRPKVPRYVVWLTLQQLVVEDLHQFQSLLTQYDLRDMEFEADLLPELRNVQTLLLELVPSLGLKSG